MLNNAICYVFYFQNKMDVRITFSVMFKYKFVVIHLAFFLFNKKTDIHMHNGFLNVQSFPKPF